MAMANHHSWMILPFKPPFILIVGSPIFPMFSPGISIKLSFFISFFIWFGDFPTCHVWLALATEELENSSYHQGSPLRLLDCLRLLMIVIKWYGWYGFVEKLFDLFLQFPPEFVKEHLFSVNSEGHNMGWGAELRFVELWCWGRLFFNVAMEAIGRPKMSYLIYVCNVHPKSSYTYPTSYYIYI